MSLPINRLPPEIISYIARCALEDDAIDARLIVPLTHVCRYWRNSITSTPENWALISSEWKGLAALSLERAKAAPLTIELKVDALTNDPKLVGFVDLLLLHIQNTTSLSVGALNSIEELAQALPNFPKSMPNLRSLTLRGGRKLDESRIDPLDFSAAHTLKDLSLQNVPLYPSLLNLTTLTELYLGDYYFKLHLDVLLDFLEQNHSLEVVILWIRFVQPSLRDSQRQTPIENRLRHLSITCDENADGRALISNIALQRGAALGVHYGHSGVTLTPMLSGISIAHLRNLSSPTFMEYRTHQRTIRLVGQDGSFVFNGYCGFGVLFEEFSLFPLDNIREFRLEHRAPSVPEELHLSSFPSLEVLAVDGDFCNSPTLLPDPTSASSLKTLAFLDCFVTEDYIAELAQSTSNRKNTTSSSLRRVVVINTSKTKLPSVASIARLREHVPVVEVMVGRELPKDLSWRGSDSPAG